MKFTTFVAGLLVAITSVQGLVTPAVAENAVADNQATAASMREPTKVEEKRWYNHKPSPKPKQKKCEVVGYPPSYATGYFAALLKPSKCATKCQRDWKCTSYSLQKRRNSYICRLYRRTTVIKDVKRRNGKNSYVFYAKECPRPNNGLSW